VLRVDDHDAVFQQQGGRGELRVGDWGYQYEDPEKYLKEQGNKIGHWSNGIGSTWVVDKYLDTTYSHRSLSNGMEAVWHIFAKSEISERRFDGVVRGMGMFITAHGNWNNGSSPAEEEAMVRAFLDVAQTLRKIPSSDRTVVHPDLHFQVDPGEMLRVEGFNKEWIWFQEYLAATIGAARWADAYFKKVNFRLLIVDVKLDKGPGDLAMRMARDLELWKSEGVRWNPPQTLPLPNGEAIWCDGATNPKELYVGYVRYGREYFYVRAYYDAIKDREPAATEEQRKSAFLSVLKSVRPTE
jgi:hypothetical protein